MQTYLKSRPAGSQLLLFIGVAILFFVFFSFAAMMVLPGMTGVSLFDIQNEAVWNSRKQGVTTFMRGMILAQFLGLFLLPSLLFAQLSSARPTAFLGMRPPHRFSYFVLGVVLLLVSFPLVELLGFLNQKMQFGGSLFQWMKDREAEATRQVQFLAGRQSLQDLLLNLFFIAVLAGVGEELFFRGVLQRLLIRITKSPWAGIVLAAALFSGFHLQFFGFLPRLLLGVLLGAMYWYSGSIWVSVLAHFLYDALLLLVMYFHPELAKDPNATMIKTSLLALPALVSVLLVALVLRRMRQQSATRFADVYKEELNSYNPHSI